MGRTDWVASEGWKVDLKHYGDAPGGLYCNDSVTDFGDRTLRYSPLLNIPLAVELYNWVSDGNFDLELRNTSIDYTFTFRMTSNRVKFLADDGEELFEVVVGKTAAYLNPQGMVKLRMGITSMDNGQKLRVYVWQYRFDQRRWLLQGLSDLIDVPVGWSWDDLIEATFHGYDEETEGTIADIKFIRIPEAYPEED